ncbi:MAG: MFS transporter [Rhodomicrobiaceae bacterium]
MTPSKTGRLIAFLNFGHGLDHFVMLIYPAAVLALSISLDRPFGDLLPYATGGFLAFGVFSMPFGWMGKHVSGHTLITVFFFGTGAGCILAGLAQTPLQIGIALTLVGVFAAIYHPIGNAMLSVIDPARVGRIMGKNGLFGNLGVASAALITGVLTDLISWRAAFIVPGLASLAAGIAFWMLVPDPGPMRTVPGKASHHIAPRAEIIRVLAILIISTTVGSFIFSATTALMPKLFEQRLTELTTTLSGVGLFVFVIYSFAAFAQVIIGSLLDKHSTARIFFIVALLQVPFLLLTGFVGGVATLLAALPMMFVVFGLIPINEVMTARYTAPEYRTRVYAVRYTFGFVAIAAAVPIVSYFHNTYGGFTELFVVLAGLSVLLTGLTVVFAMVERQPMASAQPVSA